MNILIGLFPVALMYVMIAVIAVLFWTIKFWLHRKKRRSPFPEKFLRNAGETLKKQIDDLNYDISCYILFIIMLPIVTFAIHISQSYFVGEKETLLRISTSVISTAIIVIYITSLLLKSLNKRRILRLGYDGEIAVGQCLNQIMRHGYYVFHDFPCGNFNIDHVVVGYSGVFAIETKARRKPILKDGRAEAKVIYDGNILKFPDWSERKAIAQAINQAKWLSEYLSKSVGEKISVKPVLALPGWYIERTSPNGILVINPKNISVMLKNKYLSDSTINRIVHQIDQKCRDVESKVNI